MKKVYSAETFSWIQKLSHLAGGIVFWTFLAVVVVNRQNYPLVEMILLFISLFIAGAFCIFAAFTLKLVERSGELFTLRGFNFQKTVEIHISEISSLQPVSFLIFWDIYYLTLRERSALGKNIYFAAERRLWPFGAHPIEIDFKKLKDNKAG